LVAALDHIHVDCHVVLVEPDLILHVREESSDPSRQVNDIGWLVLLENGFNLLEIPQVPIFRP